MKKFLQFSGIIAAVLAIVAFILLMATNGAVYKAGNSQYNYPGTLVLFGGKMDYVNYKLAATGLIGWILILVAIVILLAGFILPLLKVNALEKFAGILNLVAVIALVVGGILLFFSAAAFHGANDSVTSEKTALGVGWVFAAILAIVAGAIAILPAVMDLIGKKK